MCNVRVRVSEDAIETNERVKCSLSLSFSLVRPRSYHYIINLNIILTVPESFHLQTGPAHIIFSAAAITCFLIHPFAECKIPLGTNNQNEISTWAPHTVHTVFHPSPIAHTYTHTHSQTIITRKFIYVAWMISIDLKQKRVDFKHLSKLESIRSQTSSNTQLKMVGNEEDGLPEWIFERRREPAWRQTVTRMNERHTKRINDEKEIKRKRLVYLNAVD